MTQILGQPLSEVPLWRKLPSDLFEAILNEKINLMGGNKKKMDYVADPYSEEAWLAQFGVNNDE